MRSLTTGSILLTKLLTLLCFTNMGMMTMDMSVHAVEPCHQTESTNETAKDCDACITALNSWSEEYVEASSLEIPEIVFTLIGETVFTETQTALTTTIHQVYRPPPQVVWVNAFHIPQRSTVIIV